MLDLNQCDGVSRCLIQRQRPAGLAQIIQVGPIKRGQRGFDRGAEAGYAVSHASAKERNPNT